jgi:hypothetical protein
VIDEGAVGIVALSTTDVGSADLPHDKRSPWTEGPGDTGAALVRRIGAMYRTCGIRASTVMGAGSRTCQAVGSVMAWPNGFRRLHRHYTRKPNTSAFAFGRSSQANRHSIFIKRSKPMNRDYLSSATVPASSAA